MMNERAVPQLYSTILDLKFKPGSTAEATEIAEALKPDLVAMGAKQFLIVDKGDDRALALVIYETKSQQEAAAPKAQEILGSMGHLFAEPPERLGGDVLVHHTM